MNKARRKAVKELIVALGISPKQAYDQVASNKFSYAHAIWKNGALFKKLPGAK